MCEIPGIYQDFEDYKIVIGGNFVDVCAYTGKSKNNKKHEYDTERYGDNLSEDYHYYGVYQTGSMNSQLVTAWPQNEDKGELKYFYPENSTGGEF